MRGSGSDLNLGADGSAFPLSEAVYVCIWGRWHVDSGAGSGSSGNQSVPKIIAQLGNRIRKMFGKIITQTSTICILFPPSVFGWNDGDKVTCVAAHMVE